VKIITGDTTVFYPFDHVLDPMWRQGMLVIPFMTRLGIKDSLSGWNMIEEFVINPGIWSYEGLVGAHIMFYGMCFLATISHGVYHDVEIFFVE
jgi:photosystem II CP47 chlorophyll apoprotein